MSESRTEFEAMMKTYFGEAVSLAHDGAVYTDAFAGAVYLGWIQGSLAEAERFKQEMRTQAAQAQAQAGEGEAFCDANCTWLDHHKDCAVLPLVWMSSKDAARAMIASEGEHGLAGGRPLKPKLPS